MFDSETLTLSVTPERLHEIKMLVQEGLQYENATLKQLQSLIGKLNFIAHCVKPARIFMSRLLNWFRQIQDTDSPQPIPVEGERGGRMSDSGARGRMFETYRRRVVSLSKTLYSPKVLVNYPGSGGSVPT